MGDGIVVDVAEAVFDFGEAVVDGLALAEEFILEGDEVAGHGPKVRCGIGRDYRGFIGIEGGGSYCGWLKDKMISESKAYG